MPRVKCPKCGTERVVMKDKRRRCRKCGEWLENLIAKKIKTEKKLRISEMKRLQTENATLKAENAELMSRVEMFLAEDSLAKGAAPVKDVPAEDAPMEKVSKKRQEEKKSKVKAKG